MKLLRVLFGFQVVLGLFWTMPFLAEADMGLAAVGIFFYAYLLYAVTFLVGAWFCWRRPATRKWAIAVMLSPFIWFFVPTVLVSILGERSISLGAIPTLILGVLFAAVAFAIARPRRAASFIPNFVFKTRWLNILIAAFPVLLWMPLAIGFAWLIAASPLETTGNNEAGQRMGIAFAFGGAVVYAGIVGLLSFGTFLQGYIGLLHTDNPPLQKLHKIQLGISMPGVLTLIWMLSQRFMG